uniref:Macrophage mannose receptor 1-like n=1 Tax=Arion vulgaris TaxID=1028688 RepID=A0A0B7BIK3_9EUPU
MGGVLQITCLLLSFYVTVWATMCPYGWRDYPGSVSCYLITDYQVRYNFDRAMDQCTAHQAELIVIGDQNEMNWLNKEIQQLSSPVLPPKMAWWVGLEDKGQGQGVKYLNSSDVNLKLLPWFNQTLPTISTMRRCASFVNSTMFLSDCNSFYGLVCERSKDLPLSCDTESAWVYINGSCFKYFQSQQTWYLAKSTCEQFEGDIAKVSIAEEVSFIWDNAKISLSKSWIGLKSNIQTKTYKWTDESVVDPSLPWWNTNQPQDLTYMMYSDPDLCGLINGNNTRRLSSWMTEDCNEKYSFTCSKPQGVCADGWVSHLGMCLKFYRQYSLSWSSSRQYCQSLGGDLIILPTQSYQDLINTYLQELKDAGIDSFWLGLQSNNTFQWVDDTYNLNWTNWALGSPETPPDRQVAYISTGDKTGKWQLTSDLSMRRSFACFISGTKTVKEVLPPLSDFHCPDQWEVAGDTCVYFSTDVATWSQASANCQELQSQLLVVNSVDAHSFLKGRVTSGQFWIGLSDRSKEGNFTWVNGTVLNITSWAPGQPDNKEDENCVIVKSSLTGVRWFDNACLERNNYICQQQPLNMSGSSTAPPRGTPAPYSPKCGIMWEERPATNFCYQFRDTVLSWSDALELCQSFNGSLLSIVSREEQSYIEGRLSALQIDNIWIGASDRHREAGWQWDDESPFAYLNWHAGEPNDQSYENCAAINTGTMLWFDYPCNLRIGFVCKKIAEDDLKSTTQAMTVPTNLPDTQYYGCPLLWLAYDNSCYLLRRAPASWMDAQTACRKEGAALASIGSDLENKFIWSQLPKESCQNTHTNDSQCQAWADANECQKNPSWMSLNCQMSCSLCKQACSDKHTHYECLFWASIGECHSNPEWMWSNCALSCGCDSSINEGYWLGLNDRYSQMTFMWDDLSPVTYTNWLPNEPNNYQGKKEDCVKIHTLAGEWSDENCDQNNAGYICERPMAVIDAPTISPDQIGCPISGFAYGATCFVLIDTPKTWLDARSYCSDINATLATIPDSITGAFITSELIHKTSSYWIGLSENGGTYNWDSGSDIEYLDWSPSHTGNENNTCVAIRSQKPVGLWENLECQTVQPFICETFRFGFTQITRTTTSAPTTLAPCPTTWTSHEDHCYKVFFSTRSWIDAQIDCESYGGSLPSIHNDNTNNFIKTLTGWNMNGGYWIGLSDRAQESRYVWSDRSPFGFSKWGKDEPNSAIAAEDCVEVMGSSKRWNDLSCYLSRAYVCSIVRGFIMPSVLPTVSTTPSPTCMDKGWLFHGGFCYLMSPSYGRNSSLNWFKARQKCQMLGGDLASINSNDENNFFSTELSKIEIRLFWIGLNQLDQSAYVWSDGSPESFLAWGPNEPNDFKGGERCVTFYGNRGYWQDDDCGNDYGYVCKKMNSSTSTVLPVTTVDYDAVCPDGFFSRGTNNKCYYIGGRGNDSSGDLKLGWEEARDFCRNLTSPKLVDIGSIHSLRDQNLVTSLMLDLDSDLWIGLSDRLESNQYRWQDNSEVTYTNWASGQPVRHFVWSNYQDNCIEMLRSPHTPENTAKWNDASCSKKNAFLCQTKKSSNPTSSSSASVEPTSSTVCPANFFFYKSACYSVINRRKTWSEARQLCQNFKGDLASMSDIFEMSRLDIALVDSGVSGQAWIGMKYDPVSSQYAWSDGWPVEQTFWSSSDPDFQANDSCVAFSKAFWNDTSCSEVLPAICQIKSEPPIPTPSTRGYCASSNLEPFGNFCYLAKPDDHVSWPEASYKCSQMGMEIISVHSEAENNFVKGYVNGITSYTNEYGFYHHAVWLGLQRDLEGGFRWSDRTPIMYLNWNVGEPFSGSQDMTSEHCVKMSKESGRWSDTQCLSQQLGYCFQAVLHQHHNQHHLQLSPVQTLLLQMSQLYRRQMDMSLHNSFHLLQVSFHLLGHMSNVVNITSL